MLHLGPVIEIGIRESLLMLNPRLLLLGFLLSCNSQLIQLGEDKSSAFGEFDIARTR